MKKFLISLFILLLFAATVFVFGWVQIRLEPGERTLIFTKTSGWDSRVYHAGEFLWRPEALLPTNLVLYKLSNDLYRYDGTFSADLPSSEVYARELGINADEAFKFEFQVDLRYQISDAGLANFIPRLASSDKDTVQGEFASATGELVSHLAVQVENLVQRYGNEYLRHLTDTTSNEFPNLPNTIDLSALLLEELPDLRLVSSAISSIRVPDVSLYQLARGRYLTILDAQTASEASAGARVAAAGVVDGIRLDLLAKYGSVLDQYPGLVDYFRIQAETGQDPLGIGDYLNRLSDLELPE